MNIPERCTAFFRRTKRLWLLAALLAGLFVLAGWVYLENVRGAAQAYELVRINEDYTTTIALDPEGELRQPFVTEQPVYGGSFIFTTYEQVCYGTLTLSLEDEAGNVLTSTTVDTTALLDNVYQDILFPAAVTPRGETRYTYVLRFAPADQTSRLGVWCSEGSVPGLLPLCSNGRTQQATLGFSQVINQVGSWIVSAYWALVLFAAAALAAGYLLLFGKKISLPMAVFFFSLTLGVLYLFALPPYVAPDEETHIHSAYRLSNQMLGVTTEGGVWMRAGDVVELDHADEADAFSYQTAASQLFGSCTDRTLVQTDYRYANVFVLQYLPAALAVTAGRLLGVNYVTLIFLGRAANLLVYALLMALAVHIMPPQGKRMLACIGLLPMCLHLAASFNYDTMLLGLTALFFALVLDYATQRAALRWRDLALLAVVAVLMAPMKMLYVLLIPFCLIIPAKKCPSRVKYLIAGMAALGVVFAVVFAPYILHYAGVTPDSLAEAAQRAVPQVNPLNVSYVETSFWDLSYVLTHLSGAFKLLMRTLQENAGLYLSQIVGGELGEPILSDLLVWSPAVVGLWVALVLSVVPAGQERPMLDRRAKLWGGLLLLALCGALLIVVYGWTPLRNTTLWGMQGRYLLPALPLILLVCQGNALRLQKDLTRPLVFGVAYLNLFALASAVQGILG